MREELLYEIQNNFPLTKRPFLELANRLNSSEDKVIEILKKEKENGIIRQISAIFDTRKLGYKSTLVAFEVEPSQIEEAAKIINHHPGVSHNYERNHKFNLWFTIATPPDSKLGLEKTIFYLQKMTNAKNSIILPTKKMFKIAVKLDTTKSLSKKEKISKKEFKDIKLTPKDFIAIRELQKDIPIIKEPFKDSIERLNLSYEEYFAIAKRLQEGGIMRRFSAILNHRKAGFVANAMSVWSVPKEKEEEIGELFASYRAVSHCYLRPTYPSWPYNIFAMVHGQSKEECESIIEEMSKESQIKEYDKLYSTREFKKKRIQYFSPKFQEWEEEVLSKEPAL
ncbi:MAG: Lrp/AsnC family transcriptional regulator [Epsilonproteobacteria bacterium]|nr:Lrp/AsnC family transcriptional regulator [Campylobacterota bacterium]